MTDGLKDAHREAIIATIAANDHVERAVLFGSRATGTNTVTSDVDIALFGERLTLTDQARLAAALDELPMAQQVDLLLYETIDSPALREQIDRHGVEWYRRPQGTDETRIVEGAGGGTAPQSPPNCRSPAMAGEWRERSQPSDQPTVELLDVVAEMFSGGTPSKANQDYWDGSIPWLTPKDMGRWFGVTEAKVSPQAIGNGTRLAPKEAIFIAVRGMSLHNEIRVIYSNKSLAFNQDIKAIVAKECIDPLYLYYVLVSKKPKLLNAVEAAGHGTGRLPTDKLKELSIPRFGSRTETSVVHILGTLDDKIEVNQEMNATLESMAQAIFKDWFVDFGPTRAKMEGREPYLAPEIWDLFPGTLDDEGKPEGWTNGTLADLAHLNPEVWTKSTRPEKIRYVDLANTKWGRIEAITDYPRDAAPSRAQRVLRSNDTIVGTVRPGNGSFAFIADDGMTGSTGFALLRPRLPDATELIFLAATSEENIDALAHLADGAAYPAVRAEVVAASPITIPSNNMLGIFSDQTQSLFAKIAQNNRETRTLSQTRDLLLPKLISGEIRISDADKLVEEIA